MSEPAAQLDFEQIYTQHYRRVFSICLRILKNPTDAEDVAQDAFMQIHRNLHQFKGDAKITTWIHRIATNQAYMHFRKRHVRAEKDSTDEIPERPARRESIDERLDLERAISQMAPGHKAHFLLCDVAGYEQREVAQILGLAVGTAKSQISKARSKMRKLVNKRANPRIREAQTE